jgi:hypothetical protein
MILGLIKRCNFTAWLIRLYTTKDYFKYCRYPARISVRKEGLLYISPCRNRLLYLLSEIRLVLVT